MIDGNCKIDYNYDYLSEVNSYEWQYGNIQFNLIPKSNFEKKYLDIHEGKKDGVQWIVIVLD
ncbi:hypothetical protein COL68_19210 [Bacillus wiedmannii]|nr:hypothetical protein TU65_16380 [Bacillus wiedmannii]PEL21475.1 hypothetical protein CN599_01710 [Bacillus wiedmannii]PFY92930.1 hypothetical protein COL57_26560 [Bacillus wiedmannii]PFZ55487.1 hypothetical protein COL68_19210 [Bacillus wiedmannii]PGD09673.1 hypothetical protein COM34_08940 [Bacillus wiedmannii]